MESSPLHAEANKTYMYIYIYIYLLCCVIRSHFGSRSVLLKPSTVRRSLSSTSGHVWFSTSCTYGLGWLVERQPQRQRQRHRRHRQRHRQRQRGSGEVQRHRQRAEAKSATMGREAIAAVLLAVRRTARTILREKKSYTLRSVRAQNKGHS